MKSLLVIMLAMFLSACSTTSATPTTSKDKPISASGSGYTFEDAKNEAFAKAVEYVVGSAILSETESRNNSITRDEIIRYSAGYVADHKVTEQHVSGNKYYVTVDVWVKSSRIHERLLNTGKSDGNIEGPKLATQYNSYMTDRLTGDRYLQALLNDYPKHAYSLNQGDIKFMLDSRRNPIIIIPIELRWNYKYLVAISEALTQLQDGDKKSPERIKIMAKDPSAWVLGWNETFYFNDGVRADRIKNTLLGGVSINVDITDNYGANIYSKCFGSDVFYQRIATSNTIIFGNDVERNNIQIVLDPRYTEFTTKYGTAERVKLSVVRNGSC
jgi:hypothetical protein